ncbi:hypothetical protein BCR33DRAFT_701283 [Rhizoclosmatium globosum]|uniref:Phospholipid/glycerol acyltransferase domain-containing protein n=1 Tax=Rhizoclosmatium globosum TaxID=329046 RepID=A0A1Y2BRA6_9FUNG|nr:hypothetical protein BCR33DRAFT_701283 [Rhizoclosmatium globosum]|eukprot:ORY37264.1 hypothetical protein BCR33DRAFT_701283 [Rhizoclosmatium globosum]
MTAANSKKKVVLANHQAYPDWLYLWATAWVHNLHGDFRVMMIKVLSLIPIYGTKLDKDRPILKKNLGIARKEDLPLWMLIFPEGTLNTPGNIEKSKKFAEKMQIAEHPNHCILPKSTGLFYTIQDLQPTCTDVFDLTIGYSNVTPGDIPFEVMNPIEVFFNGRYPKTVHIHCRQYSVPEIPGFEPDMINQPEEDRKKPFDTWLRTIWLEKDTYLARFYETKKMTSNEEKDGKLVPLIPRSEDFLYLFMVLLGGYLILPVYVRLAYWAVYAVLYVVYWALWVVFKVVGFSRLTLWIAALLFLDGLVRGKRKATVTQA